MAVVSIALVPGFAFGHLLHPAWYHRNAYQENAVLAASHVPDNVVVEAASNVASQLTSRDTVLLWDGDGSSPLFPTGCHVHRPRGVHLPERRRPDHAGRPAQNSTATSPSTPPGVTSSCTSRGSRHDRHDEHACLGTDRGGQRAAARSARPAAGQDHGAARAGRAVLPAGCFPAAAHRGVQARPGDRRRGSGDRRRGSSARATSASPSGTLQRGRRSRSARSRSASSCSSSITGLPS